MIARFTPCLSLALALLLSPAAAQDVYVPDELEPWREWVLAGREYRQCPYYFDRNARTETEFVCAWPGRLELEVTDDGSRFRQTWSVYAADQWIPLPGNLDYWPQQIAAAGTSVAVVARNGAPMLRLAPGEYAISGRFEWAERPSRFPVPAETGLVALTIDGERIVRPERTGNMLWFGEDRQEQRIDDALGVQVFRLIEDDVPTRLVTRMRLDVSGSVREERIAPALPAGFTPMAINSDLPARLEADGALRLQVRPGRWNIQLLARADDVLNAVPMPAPQTNLPAVEIWSYRTNDALRVTVAEGLAAVDPTQVDVPPGWRELPAYRGQSGEALNITERSRGKVATEHQLGMTRRLWLDFDGGGLVYADHIFGRMQSEWRLDMQLPYALLSATQNDENLLVTVGDREGLSGVEVRQADLDIETLGRTESRGRLPVTGWTTPFANVSTTLYLPPGHQLFAATGSDRNSDSWVNEWQLLDFFLVLITAIAAARLFGRSVGILALAALTLSLHEPGAPGFIWLNLLVAVALARVAPAGNLQRASLVYRNLSFAILVLIFVPFAANQLRIAIYPQLEAQGYMPDFALQEKAVVAPEAPMESRFEQAAPTASSPADRAMLDEIVVTAAQEEQSSSRYAPNAIVQVGPGRPDWQWNAHHLNWSGPVEPEHTTRIVVISRWLVTILRFMEVFLLGGLAAVFAFELLKKPLPWIGRTGGNAPAASLLCAGLLMAASLLASAPASADTPSDSILRELEARLLAPPPCVPRCAEIVDASVDVSDDSLSIRLDTDALGNVAVSLPGSLNGWHAEQITVDGRNVTQVYRTADQVQWLRIPTGHHVITLQGSLPPVDSLEVPFPAVPRVISVAVSGWFVSGVDDRRLTSGSLQLTRLRPEDEAEGPARWESNRFPVFTHVERTIMLDLDWRVTTTVHRVAPVEGAITTRIPLLAGESVNTENVTVTDGEVQVSMNPSQRSMSWESTLERQSPLVLEARTGVAWKEIWSFAVGAVWHADFAGIPESEAGDLGVDYRVARFFPRPGESLSMSVDRPEATSGDTMVFDEVDVTTTAGLRSRTTSLSLGYRSTRGQQHTIRLPDNAEVTSVMIDGTVTPLRAEDGALQLSILPGDHDIDIEWRDGESTGLVGRMPAVDLAAGASNVSLQLEMPPNRWILATFGPKLGPGVLYWTEFVVLLIAAGILARSGDLTPLKTRHWLLLGLGFSTFSWLALAIVVAWLLVVGSQRRFKSVLGRETYNAAQAGIGLLSVVALITIVISLPAGLLGRPDMHIVGNGSYDNVLAWFGDRASGTLPDAFAISVPMWIYKVLILAWALWLSFALLRWLPWAWSEFAADGLWRQKPAAQ